MTWAKLLRRVFMIDITRCPVCDAKTLLENREVVTSPFVALGLAGRAPARAPPLRLLDEDDMDQRYIEGD